jgi:hypothetical protein
MVSSPSSTAADRLRSSAPHTAPDSRRYHTMRLRGYGYCL